MTLTEFTDTLTRCGLPGNNWSIHRDLSTSDLIATNSDTGVMVTHRSDSGTWRIQDSIMWVQASSLKDAINEWTTYCDWS